MANNRTEFKTQVVNLIKAIVNISKHRQTLNDELADSINFRKDVKSSTITASSSNNNIDFVSNDLVTINSATNNLDLVLTILNTEDGEDSKYIRVIKDAGDTVTFSGAIDISSIDTKNETSLIYQIINKNSTVYVKAINEVTKEKIVEIGSWNMDSTATISVAHGVDHTKIRHISAMLRRDDDTFYYNVFFAAAGSTEATIAKIDSTDVYFDRENGSIYDGANFDSTAINRGWIYIRLEI